MSKNYYDILIAGAGAAGLMAAYELSRMGKSIAVIEARDRTGGRIHALVDKNFSIPVEAGAEFIHGKLELTLELLKQAEIKYKEVNGDIWKKEKNNFEEQKDFIEDYSMLEKKCKALSQDRSVAEFLEEHFRHKDYEDLRSSLKNYVEGYHAADTSRASMRALCLELMTADDIQFRIEGGYVQLINYLEYECRKNGVEFYLSHPVKKVNWKKNDVHVITDQHEFFGKKIVFTLPIGVLRSEINFSPALPEKINAAKELGYGPVVKTVLEFEEKFWNDKELTAQKDLSKFSFIFSQEKIPTWWTQYPNDAPMLTGWSGGPHAEEIAGLSDEEIKTAALKSLSSIFNIALSLLTQKLIGWYVFNWTTDPFSLGAYSYAVVGGKQLQDILKEPVEGTLFFAGEGLYDGPEIGTVEGALRSGRQVVGWVAGEK